MNSTTGSKYTENIYIHLKLIFAFAAQSSLSKVRNDNVRPSERCSYARDVRRAHTAYSIRAAYTNQFFEPVIPVPYLVARLAPFLYYVQLHIDEAILCIMNDVMIVLY